MATNPYFDPNGRPRIDFELSNPLGWSRPVAALIDTGFNGFISLAINQAFPIGLLLRGTMSVTLADGNTHAKLYCLGGARFEGEYKVGIVLIEFLSDIALVGMEFLRVFSRELLVNLISGTVTLNKVVPPTSPAIPAPPSSSKP